MALRRLAAKSCSLEVERKFRSLAVRELTRTAGIPHFKSLRPLPVKTIHDTYYDRSDILSAAGAWIRRRNGEWEAKIRHGGDFTNSRFEELKGARDIAARVGRILGRGGASEADHFGLLPMASFVTERQAWIADEEFRIVLDRMDFGHEVGEVELEQEILAHEEPSEEVKNRVMHEMDERIVEFMERYHWAFTPGKPTGKLSAYFERQDAMARRAGEPRVHG